MEGDKRLVQEIRQSDAWDEELVDAIERLKEGVPRALSKGLEEWNTEDGLILYQGKVYVPKDVDLRRRVVALHHDTLPAGHPGRWKTYELVSRNYWWPGMSTFIEKYVTGCDTCSQTKNRTHQPFGPLKPNTVPTAPWQIISCDLITQLPKSAEFDAILVVVDRLTKQAHFLPTTSEVDAAGIADLFISAIWKLHGTPKEVISDRGPQFAAKFLKHVFSRLGIKSSLSTAYHPQSDGQTERVNQELEQYLRAFVNYRQTNWAALLPMAEFTHNSRAHSATRVSPFQLVYGYDPGFTVHPTGQTSVPAAEARLEELSKAREEAQAALEVAADRMKRYYDRGVQEAPKFRVGDRVWLEATNINVTRTRKLANRRLGPFPIIRVVSEVNYELELPHTMRIHPVFHVSLLTPHREDKIPGRVQPAPPPVVVDGDEEYEVDSILDAKKQRGKIRFLVHWKGYSPEHDSWEPEEALANAPEKLTEFYREFPTAPGAEKHSRGLEEGVREDEDE